MSEPRIDPLVDRAVEELRTLPPLNREAVSRIVAAAAAARVNPADDDAPSIAPARNAVRWLGTLGLVAAAAIAGFMLRGTVAKPTAAPVPVSSTSSPTGQAMIPASAGDPDVAPIPTAFTLEATGARRVTLVGDFNKWNPAAAPLAHQPGTATWSIVVPIVPGRHLYAFMVDDSLMTLDPRAPRAKDPSLGVESSVVMVGKP